MAGAGDPPALTKPMASTRLRLWAGVVAILLLAAGVRLWRIGSIPAGLYYDEAGHLLAAQSIGQDGHWPVYFGFGEGNDPLFAYLARVNLAILGRVPWAGRLVSACAGIVGVAVIIRAGQALYPRRAVGPAAGLLAATLFWHLDLSRYGTQPMLAATLTTGAVVALWLAMRRTHGGWRRYVMGGLLTGLGLLTYVAARLMVAVPLAVLVGGLLAKNRRSVVRGFALSGVVCGLVILPQAFYFVKNPEAFTDRFRVTTGSTLFGGSPLRALAGNIGLVLGGLVTAGPTDQRQNIPGRPALDAVQVALLMAGFVALALGRRTQASAAALTGWWLFIGLLPAMITENPPNFQRTVFAIPPLTLLLAAGIEFVWRQTPWPLISRPALAALLGLSAAGHLHAFMVRWASDPATSRAFDEGLYWITQQLRSAPQGMALYETPIGREWLTFEFGLGPERYDGFRDFNGRECLVLPAVAARGARYAVVTEEDRETLPALRAAFPAGQLLAEHALGGAPYASIFEVPAGTPAIVAPARRAVVRFADQIELVGYTLEAIEVPAGAAVNVDVYWLMLSAATSELKTFTHILGTAKPDGSPVYAQRDAQPCDNAYPTWQWPAGEVLIDRLSLAVPPETPTGTYQLNVGWYDAATLQRLEAFDASGAALGNSVELQMLEITSP